MAEPARHLHIVDAETGEQLSSCPSCQEKDHIITGHETTIKGWEIKYGKLKADKEKEARNSPLWPIALKLFRYWQERCRHPRADWGVDRFELVVPFLKSKGYGETVEDRESLCRRAIDGAAFDPNTRPRRNGSTERFDGWELVFRSRDKFESFVNRAPIGGT